MNKIIIFSLLLVCMINEYFFFSNFKKKYKEYLYNKEENNCTKVQHPSIKNCSLITNLTENFRCCYIYEKNKYNNCIAINESKSKNFFDKINKENESFIANCFQDINFNDYYYTGKKGIECENKMNITKKEDCLKDKDIKDKNYQCCYIKLTNDSSEEENEKYCVPIKKGKDKKKKFEKDLKIYYSDIYVVCFSNYLSNTLVLLLLIII